jgi:transcriptional regulator with XRE-family HTH domain
MNDGPSLRALRLELGVSRASMARELGYDPHSISSAERSKHPRAGTVENYMGALDRVVRKQAAERSRVRVEELLALAAE